MSATHSLPTMRAAVIETEGKPVSHHVKLTTMPTPTIDTPTEVLIRVLSAAINPIDKAIITGELKTLVPIELPAKLGFDVSGIVERVGVSVTRFKAGDEVFARVDHHRMGTIAEYVVTSEHSIAMKPRTMSHDEAASLPLVALTALQGMRDVGGLTAGQRILITGGSGGVGTAAIQIARCLGVSEINVTCSSQDVARVTELGATRTIDYKGEKFNELLKDLDVVFDTIGEANSAFSTVKKGSGTVVSTIAALTPQSMKDAGMDVSTVATVYLTAASAPVLANAALHSATYKSIWMKPDGAELTEIAQWVDSGKMKAVIDKVYPFEQTGAAFDQLADGHVKGKIVIHIADK